MSRTLPRRPDHQAAGRTNTPRSRWNPILAGTNALKYGAEGTPIEIEAEYDGEGIATDQLERIFEPFVPLTPSAERPARKGIGLGLAISRDLARAMGGDITVLGQGSTFEIELPGR